jgi:hypothetical protein
MVHTPTPQQVVQVVAQLGTAAILPHLEQHYSPAVPVAVLVMQVAKAAAATLVAVVVERVELDKMRQARAVQVE